MSLPRIVSQVVILGSQILGKAFVEAYKQAARNARSGTSQSSSAGHHDTNRTDLNNMNNHASMITRKHKMTIDEACQILNINKVPFSDGPHQPLVSEELKNMLKSYDGMFLANQNSSKYLLSKIVRAKDRISAEVELSQNTKNSNPNEMNSKH